MTSKMLVHKKIPDTLKTFTFVSFTFFFLYYLSDLISREEIFNGINLHFYDLTLPLISALLVLYRLKAIPTLFVFFIYLVCIHDKSALLTYSAQIMAASASQVMYWLSAGKRGKVSFGRSQLTTRRIIWLVCFNAFLFLICHQWLMIHFSSIPDISIFNLQSLINLQWLMTSCLTGIPFCYILLRAIHKPDWGLSYLRQLKTSVESGTSVNYQKYWLMLLLILMYCLITTRDDSLIFSDYSLLWLLPVMLWGTMCIGQVVTLPIWVIMLMLLGYYTDDYIRAFTPDSYLHSLAVSSTMLYIFSLTIVIAGVLSSRSRNNIRQLKKLYRSEPNTGLPSFQALGMDMQLHSAQCLCHIRCPELNTLEQTHGVEFRFAFVKALCLHVRSIIQEYGEIYYGPGHGIIIRFDAIPDIAKIYKSLNAFRFTWQEFQLGLSCGLSYTIEKNLIKSLSQAVKQLNTQSYRSLLQGKPLELNPHTPGDNIVSQAVIRHVLQKAIDRQSFLLMAQPIVSTLLVVQPIISTYGKMRYHEVLLRIKMSDGKLIFPDTILPVAQKAGLLPTLDMTVIEQTLRFMKSSEESHPDSHFSINITPESLQKTDFLDNVYMLFDEYMINPERIIFEVVESDIIDNVHVLDVLQSLRKSGVKIAIDDFGTGASSYSRLRDLEADILKIDGSFIKNILEDEFSRCAVRSFCEVAKLKNMEIVAEFVENEEIEKVLIEMGIQWLQGYHIGKPVPIETAEL